MRVKELSLAADPVVLGMNVYVCFRVGCFYT